MPASSKPRLTKPRAGACEQHEQREVTFQALQCLDQEVGPFDPFRLQSLVPAFTVFLEGSDAEAAFGHPEAFSRRPALIRGGRCK